MKGLPVGKLPLDLLERLLNKYTCGDERVVVGAKVGEDATVIDFGDRYLVAKTDPITFVAHDIGWYAVTINGNDLATMGARPKWFMATLLLPEVGSTVELAEDIFGQFHRACGDLGIWFVGGHTEITYGLDRPIVVGQMLGEVSKDKLVCTGGAKVGDEIVLTKGIAIEGTSIIAREKEEYLRGKGYDDEFIGRAKDFIYEPGISVIEEALLANESAKVNSMHDPTEGGLAVGLYELCKAAGVGLVVDEGEIKVLRECQVLCEEFGLNPLGLIASGALVLTVDEGEVGKLGAVFDQSGIEWSVIGEVVDKAEGMKIRIGGRLVDLPYFERDEITKVLSL